MSDDGLEQLRGLLRCNLPGYRRDGTPIVDVFEWSFLHANLAYVHVGCTMIGDVEVSTVWIGVPQAGSTPERPLIFETMIFGSELDAHAWRYATEAEAEAGHDAVVELVRAAVSTPGGP
jgi:hypothetical protein